MPTSISASVGKPEEITVSSPYDADLSKDFRSRSQNEQQRGDSSRGDGSPTCSHFVR